MSGLVSVPLAVNYLGPERYGLWMTISSVIAVLAFADLGIGNGLINSIVEANGTDDFQGAQKSMSSAFFLFVGIGAAVLFLFALAYPLISWSQAFNVTSILAIKESGPAIAVFVACLALSLPLDTVQRVQLGFQEGFESNLWQCLGNLLGLGSVILAIHLRLGLPWLVLCISGAPVLGTLVNWIVQFRYTRPWLFPRWRYANWNTGRNALRSGSVFLLLQLFALLGLSSDNIVIAHILGPQAVAKYAVVQKLFSVTLIVQFFIIPLWPAFGDAIERSDFGWARRTLIKTLIFSLSITALSTVPLLIFGRWIVRVLVSPQLAPAFSLLFMAGLWGMLMTYIGTMSVLLNTRQLFRKQLIFYGAASIVALSLKIVLARTIGLAGVPLATVIGYGLLYVIPAAFVARHALRDRVQAIQD
jgi:O-antigen/teichoic acid export membrane protein